MGTANPTTITTVIIAIIFTEKLKDVRLEKIFHLIPDQL